MKKSILAILTVAALAGNVALASSPSQDKPVSQTTTTVKKTTPVKGTVSKTTKSVHKKHVKSS